MMAGNELHSDFVYFPGHAEQKQALTQGLGAEDLLTLVPGIQHLSLLASCCTWSFKLTSEGSLEEMLLHFSQDLRKAL